MLWWQGGDGVSPVEDDAGWRVGPLLWRWDAEGGDDGSFGRVEELGRVGSAGWLLRYLVLVHAFPS